MTTEQETPNTWVHALAAIKRTPVGESGGYRGMPFFRDDRWSITLIHDSKAEQFNNDHGAAELVRRNLP